MKVYKKTPKLRKVFSLGDCVEILSHGGYRTGYRGVIVQVTTDDSYHVEFANTNSTVRFLSRYLRKVKDGE